MMCIMDTMKKCFKFDRNIGVLFVVFFVFLVEPIFAESSSLKDDADTIKDGTSTVLQGIGHAFRDAGQVIGEKTKELGQAAEAKISQRCLGLWEYKNGDSRTIIDCNISGLMKIKQQNGRDITIWRGTFSSTDSEISFHVTSKTKEFLSSSDNMDESWVLKYKVITTDQKSVLRTKCSSLPADANGHKFSRYTEFIKK